VLETLLAKTQKFLVLVLALMLVVVVVLSTLHLAVLIGHEVGNRPAF